MTRSARTRAVCVAAAGIMAGSALFSTAARADVGDGPGGLTLTPSSGSTLDDPVAAYASANACPADHRSLATVALQPLNDLTLITLTGNLTPTDTPPSGNLDQGTGLAQILESAGAGAGVTFGSGDYDVALLCYDENFETVTAADAWIHINLEARTWNVIEGPTNPGAVDTTTTLAADPTSVEAGGTVTLTATVTGDGAAGSVEFLDGSNSLGSADVSGGTATKTVTMPSAGSHSLTAKFTPNDPAAFKPSTSDPVTVTVTGTGGGGEPQTGNQSVNVTVPQTGGGGDLTMEVGNDPVDLTQVSGEDLSFEGDLSPITVTDGRDEADGWDVKGSTSDFHGGSNTIDGNQLGWTPKVTAQNPQSDVVPGQAVAPANPGLKDAAVLASAEAGKGAGASTLGATLDLDVPADTPAGNYSATLTITLMSK